MEQTINCLVIDDDPEVNDYVCEMVRQTPFLRLIGTHAFAHSALSDLEKKQIDLLILDINLPGLDGVTFARMLKTASGFVPPKVILISGSREHALAGYKVDAIDYLVKPFGYEEFYGAVIKARGMMSPPTLSSQLRSDHLFLKVEHDLTRVNISDIRYLESFKDYVKVFTSDQMIVALSTLKGLEEKLASHRFMRIHRSFIINLDKIDAIQHMTVRFGRTIIPVTEQYRQAFRAEFSDWL
ncbi:response regulator transcription factor [Mucilaginibacter sp. JRF]|uniref:LytR/AlgR family response regulator transcription factor n=1 Tax=Mucilaginibacter sp. JRF TaxID=2780088 RepID=UPI001880E1C5|nr:LytTR family DNA-binding domain-containing protein [Mucilaginibacter sp. JRF]MBE9584267.1 response regulator transcription factor [Mucilaginibacter sp. JRF]